MYKDLKKIYYDLSDPRAYSGAHKILKKLKYEPEDVINWLEGQDSYTLHKLYRKNYPRRMYNVWNVGDLWECDLGDFRKYKKENDNYAYAFVCIDVLSKYVYVEPIMNKKAQSVAEAFAKILSRSNHKLPIYLQGDRGKEFLGSDFQKFIRRKGIMFRETRNPNIKASCAVRFLRTLKEKIWRYFTHNHTGRYIDVLQKIVDTYNRTQHSATKMTPASVTLHNAEITWQNLIKRYGYKKKPKRCKYRIGALVRISEERSVFAKGYE